MTEQEQMQTGRLLLALAACAIHQTIPDQNLLADADLDALYQMCRSHSLTALIAYALERAGVKHDAFSRAKNASIRQSIMFDVERKKLLSFCEQEGIWYMPLKGIFLKEDYPNLGMRQMCDNDILVDAARLSDLDSRMKAEGYHLHSQMEDNDISYQKEPFYNFELHRTLIAPECSTVWHEYYRNIKEKLQKDSGNAYGYHFTREDFYIYYLVHENRHYTLGGTGLRLLTDCCILLEKYGSQMDWEYVHRECEKLGIAAFEEQVRTFTRKFFSDEKQWELSKEDDAFLRYLICSGTYGTTEHKIKNTMDKMANGNGECSKSQYLFRRLFPPMSYYEARYPFYYQHKVLLPIAWGKRLVNTLILKRDMVSSELSWIRKSDSDKT